MNFEPTTHRLYCVIHFLIWRSTQPSPERVDDCHYLMARCFVTQPASPYTEHPDALYLKLNALLVDNIHFLVETRYTFCFHVMRQGCKWVTRECGLRRSKTRRGVRRHRVRARKTSAASTHTSSRWGFCTWGSLPRLKSTALAARPLRP